MPTPDTTSLLRLARLIPTRPPRLRGGWGGGGRPGSGAISSRTPEGHYGRCPVCREFIRIEPSGPAGDAPCPCCGHLIWFGSPLLPIQDDPPAPSRTPNRLPLVARVAVRARRVLRSIAGARVGPRRTEPTSPSTSGVWDRWLDG